MAFYCHFTNPFFIDFDPKTGALGDFHKAFLILEYRRILQIFVELPALIVMDPQALFLK